MVLFVAADAIQRRNAGVPSSPATNPRQISGRSISRQRLFPGTMDSPPAQARWPRVPLIDSRIVLSGIVRPCCRKISSDTMRAPSVRSLPSARSVFHAFRP